MDKIKFDIDLEGTPPANSLIDSWRRATAVYLKTITNKTNKGVLRAAAIVLVSESIVICVANYTEIFKTDSGDLSGFASMLIGVALVWGFFAYANERFTDLQYVRDDLNHKLENIPPNDDVNQDILQIATNVPEIRTYVARVNQQGRSLIRLEADLFQDYHERYALIVAVRELHSIKTDDAAPTDDGDNSAPHRRVSV